MANIKLAIKNFSPFAIKAVLKVDMANGEILNNTLENNILFEHFNSIYEVVENSELIIYHDTINKKCVLGKYIINNILPDNIVEIVIFENDLSSVINIKDKNNSIKQVYKNASMNNEKLKLDLEKHNIKYTEIIKKTYTEFYKKFKDEPDEEMPF